MVPICAEQPTVGISGSQDHAQVGIGIAVLKVIGEIGGQSGGRSVGVQARLAGRMSQKPFATHDYVLPGEGISLCHCGVHGGDDIHQFDRIAKPRKPASYANHGLKVSQQYGSGMRGQHLAI